MIKANPGEQWKEIQFSTKAMRNSYAVSNHGRVASFKKKFEEGNVISGTINNGYLSLKIKPGGKDLQMMIHRLVAGAFIKRKSAKHDFVIHLNFKKTDNRTANLRWTTKEEMQKHQQKSPNVIASRIARKSKGHKLTIAKVKDIKRKIKNGKTPMKALAKQHKISEMQLYRIRRGENWGEVKA
ncbi:MAG TPA: NUMOD4 domain-containing protein [Bacteroidia bacterium]|nr:NUMOD4 domain-containing protein [Bacteroidia bacterium]